MSAAGAGVRLIPVSAGLGAAASVLLGLPLSAAPPAGGALPPAPTVGALPWPEGLRPAAGFPREEDLFGLAQGAGGFLIVLDGEVIGSCGPKGGVQAGRQEIGYGLAGGFRGRGLGTAAVRLLLAELASRPGIERISAEVAVGNEPSVGVLRKLGFELESGPAAGYTWWSRAVSVGQGSSAAALRPGRTGV